MRKLFFYLILLFAVSYPSILKAFDPDDLVGYWDGYSVYKNNPLYFSIDFLDDSTFRAFFSSDEQRALNIPLNKLKATRDTVFFELQGDNDTWKFHAYYYHNKAKGTVEKGNLTANFQLERGDAPEIKYDGHDTTFRNDSITLSGTLNIPRGKGPFPAIIFTHGSGDEARYANAYIADYFANKGFVTLIYDKRGVNKSTGNWRESNFINLANDCISGIKFLQSDPRVINDKVGVYGQSQGGSICPLVTVLYPKTAFVISAASCGVSMLESDLFEARNRLSKHITGDALELALSLIKLEADYAITGEGWEKIEEANDLYSGEKWYQDYVNPPSQDNWWYGFYNKTGNYNPVDFWKKVTQPVLILKGDHDQVCPGYPTFQNIEEALKKAGNAEYKIVFFLNSDHEFHVIDRSNEFWFKGTPNYCETIYDWLNKNKFTPDKKALKTNEKDNDVDEDEEQ
jgi:dipeptidyl aminopeptidase/acylaminoacyl peptidase